MSAVGTKWNWPICIQSKKGSLKSPGFARQTEERRRRNLPNGSRPFFLSLVICYAVQSVTLMGQGKPCCHCLIDFWRRPCSQEHCESSLLNLHMANVVSEQVRDAHRGRAKTKRDMENNRGQAQSEMNMVEKMKGKDTWNCRETERSKEKNRDWQCGRECGQAKGVSS